MQELSSQEAEYLFSALPILFLVSLLAISGGVYWLVFRLPTREQLSGLPDAAQNAGPNRETGGHSENVPPESLPLKERLQALEGFLDENPPETVVPDSTEASASPNEVPTQSEGHAKAPTPSGTSAKSEGRSSDELRDAQLRSVVQSLKNRLD